MRAPLQDTELELLFNNGESDRVEFKPAMTGSIEAIDRIKESIKRSICAFSNDLPNHNSPGIIFIGISDNGTIDEEEITDDTIKKLSNFRSDGTILPPPVVTIEKRHLINSQVAIITVLPSESPPTSFKGAIYVRVGPTTRQAFPSEEQQLSEKRRYKDKPFDIHPVSSATLENLSKTTFELEYLPTAFSKEILEENGRTYPEKLAACKMIESPTSPTPTILGLLTVGLTPQDFLPGAYIQFLKLAGETLDSDVIDEETITGNLSTMITKSLAKLESHYRRAYDITTQPTHIVERNYPPTALEQLLYNAVLHRNYEGNNTPIRIYWYSNRIEIISPGGPFGEVTLENFGKPGITAYRNPNIASVLKNYTYIQQFGRGIATAKKALTDNGNPELEFDNNLSFITAIIRKKS